MPEVIFNGSEGRIEGRYHHSKRRNAPIALLLHPHPRFGGSMNNRVVYQVFHAFARREFSALRFNFRGVGRSQGVPDDGQGELADAAAALDWLQAANPDAEQCWIGGFSFGAWVGMQLLMRRPEISGFIAVAPPANRYDFSFLAPCPASGLIVHGDSDDLVPVDSASALATKLSHQRHISVAFRPVDGANHFFHNKLDELTVEVDRYLDAKIAKQKAVARG
ncbi:MAG: alpha/beta fold hydrolase [Alphaproteobacteria bacterium]|nr:alpha/beta fold hydrolase [Alphaproteobacteria bacterium]